ncbi:MAG: hypothetical protein MZV63_28385 [Marinilabiliales bacterium]|nr:hypothetical protein [Marinilabiliales bacterium]
MKITQLLAIARSEGLLKELKNACIRENLKNKLKTIVFDLEKTNEIKDLSNSRDLKTCSFC